MATLAKNPLSPRSARLRRGYTLTDVVVATAIILAAALIGLVWLTAQRETARRAQCEKNFQVVSEALLRLEENQAGFPGWREPDGKRAATVSWGVRILPYLEVIRTREEIESGRRDGRTGPWKDMTDLARFPVELGGGKDLRIPWQICPTVRTRLDPRGADSTIAVNTGMPDDPRATPPDARANGVFQDGAQGRRDSSRGWTAKEIEDRDGLQHTLLIAENIDAGPWIADEEGRLGVVWTPEGHEPAPLPFQVERGQGYDGVRRARPASWHAPGATVAFCDGRTGLFHRAIDPIVFARLMTVDHTATEIPGSSEPLTTPWRDEPRPPESEANDPADAEAD